MSKGDNRRPSSIPKEEYDENFESIFGKKKLNIWEDKDDELTTGDGNHSCGGENPGVSEEPVGRPDPEAVPPTKGETSCAETRQIVSDDKHYGCPVCGTRLTSWDIGGGDGFYHAQCGACSTKWILFSDTGERRGLRTWEEVHGGKEEIPGKENQK